MSEFFKMNTVNHFILASIFFFFSQFYVAKIFPESLKFASKLIHEHYQNQK